MDENEIPQSPTIDCLKCKKKFEVILPKAETLEGATASILIWAHPEPQLCPFCGQAYQMKISKLMGFAVNFHMVQNPNDDRVITVPSSALANLKH